MNEPPPAASSSSPPVQNPVLSAYEGFVRDTPLVSRYVLTSLFSTWFLSFFIDTTFAVSNIPYFSFTRLEIYRILVSPLACSNLLSLIFAYWSFVDHGKRLEYSMGSAAFGWLFFSLGVITNLFHNAVCYLAFLGTDDRGWLFVPASGIWTVLFGLVAMECCHAPPQSTRRLFVIAVPTLQYPLVLLAIFTLLSGIQISNFFAVAVGYAYGYGYLERTKLSPDKAKQWEDTYLASLAKRDGWVYGHAATGGGAWSDMGATPAAAVGGGGPSMNFFRDTPQAGDHSTPNTYGTDVFPTGSGRALGGPTRRSQGTTDARAARLKALEQQQQQQQQQSSSASGSSGGPVSVADNTV